MLSDNPMKFNTSCKLDLAAASEPGRYAVHHVNLDVMRSTLTATDGRILAIVPCEPEEGDTDGLIPREAIRLARTGCKAAKAQVYANGTVKAHSKAGIVEMPRPEGDFPRYRDVIPAPASDDIRLGLDVELLWHLVQALGRNPERGYQVELRINRGGLSGDGAVTTAVLVRPIAYEGDVRPLGAIMPVSL